MAAADAARDFAETDACDARFHALVVERSGHERMRRVWQSAHPVVWTAAMPALREANRQPRLAGLHRRFLAELAAATPLEAQEAMILHIRNGEHLAIRNVSAKMDGGLATR
jgi:DNA-binding GntR family transcriptional regulator